MSSSLILRLAAILIAATVAASPAGAQGFDLFHHSAPQTAPPSDVPDGSVQQEENQAAALVVRVNRLEEQLRQANGRIEELENAQRRLEEELQKFRQDVEFRFGDRSGGAPLAAAAPAVAPPSAVAVAPPVVIDGSAPPIPRRSDAFNPNADPNAPGAPRPLGTTPPSAPLASGALASEAPVRSASAAPGAPLELGAGPPPASGPTIVNSGVAILDGPRDQYNAALQAFQSGQFQQAEDGFKAFITANPGHRLTPDADFYIGETYFQRSRPREAAEQYLKVTTDFARSSRAPESMVRLGQTLAALGNKDQACATFAEFGKRYPTATASVKRLADREMAKNHC